MPTLKPEDLIIKLLTALLQDAATMFHQSRIDQISDRTTALRRLRNEGSGFVTKTLPGLGKHFDACLQSGIFTPFPAFKRQRGGPLPCFLKGLTKFVFDTSGTLQEYPDTDAIRLIRQICFMFYKLDLGYSEELVDAKVNRFVESDINLSHVDTVDPNQMGILYHVAKIIGIIFKDFDHREITPRPGPGQCSTRVPHEMRFEPQTLYSKVHRVYPYYRYYYSGSSHLLDSVHRYRSLPRARESISRLALVPKDSRGPRIICMEPPELMWLQQGLRREIYDHIEHHPLTRGQINFTDQTINGALALWSSKWGKYVTLDMEEASDLISRALVELSYDEVPGLLSALLSLSSDYIELPNGDLLHKKKYAPMGSALCFPVMATVHFALAVASIHLATGLSYKKIARDVYVYGDDLIVKSEHAQYLLDDFPLFGLRFNKGKCCLEGHFRESCGVDAYNGKNVTPMRVKSISHSANSASDLDRYLAYFHGLFNRGLWNAARQLQVIIENIWGDLPCCSKQSSVLGWVVPRSSVFSANKHWGWDKKTQQPAKRVRISISPRPRKSMIGGWEQLLRAQLLVRKGSSAKLQERSQSLIGWKRVPLSGF